MGDAGFWPFADLPWRRFAHLPRPRSKPQDQGDRDALKRLGGRSSKEKEPLL